MNIEIITVPDTVFCATDSCLPRWRFIAGAINRTNRNLTLKKFRIDVKGSGRILSKTFTDTKLDDLILQGSLSLKRKEVVAVEVSDDGEINRPHSVNIYLHFSDRNGACPPINKEIVLSTHKTIWLDFPLRGKWTTITGRVDHHCIGRQFGFDFVTPEDSELLLNPEAGKESIDNFTSFKKPLHSPADGIIISCRNGAKDYRRAFKPTIGDKPVTWGEMAGNYVVIKTEQNQFILLAHMLRHSLEVKKGDIVSAGQVLGAVGNSGNTTGSHLHMEVMNEEPDLSRQVRDKEYIRPSGVPFGFRNITRTRKTKEKKLTRCVPDILDHIEK